MNQFPIFPLNVFFVTRSISSLVEEGRREEGGVEGEGDLRTVKFDVCLIFK